MSNELLKKTNSVEVVSTSTSIMAHTISEEGTSFSIPSIKMPEHLMTQQLIDYILPVAPFEIGGQGEIYRAQHKKDGKFAMIKTMRKKNYKTMVCFAQESKALFLLQNKENIVNILMSFHNTRYTYIVTDYIDGLTIEKLFDRSMKFSCQAILETLRQLCVGLNTIHNMAIIHGDISPANVMISRGGILKIIDFGICRINSVKTEKVFSSIGWSPNYPAPEMDSNLLYDYKIDLYASGKSLTVMLKHWVPCILLNSAMANVLDRTSVALIFGEIFEILRMKNFDERILTIFESWLQPKPEDRLDSSIWLNCDHFPEPLDKELYAKEIFKARFISYN